MDATTMTRLWWGRTGSAQKSSPAISSNNVAYIGGQDSYFWVYDANSGKQLENLGKFAGAFQSSPALAYGKVYCGNWDGKLYCFKAGTPTSISCWVDRQTATLGDTVYVRGAISPSVGGATVTISYRTPDFTVLNRTVTTSSDGAYEDAFTPDVIGPYAAFASWTGTATYGRSSSTSSAYVAPAIFEVKAAEGTGVTATTTNVAVSPTSVAVGKQVTITGSISPAVAGVQVSLQIVKPDTSTITRAVSTASDGSFTDKFALDAAGTWSVTAGWAGNAAFSASRSNSVTFTATTTEQAGAGAAAGISNEVIATIVAAIAIIIVVIVGVLLLRRKK